MKTVHIYSTTLIEQSPDLLHTALPVHWAHNQQIVDCSMLISSTSLDTSVECLATAPYLTVDYVITT